MGITKEHLERIEKQAEVMESFGDAAVGISSELDAMVQDNYQMEQQIEFLLETNDRLRKQLDSDAYMKLPLDADGVPIRIGDKVNVDGEAMTVLGYRLHNGELLLIVKKMESNITFTPKPSDVRRFKYTPSDSWEKLEEDATQQSCGYFGIDRTPASCDDCPHGWEQTGRACWRNARLDILARAKKLAGIEEEARND